MSVLSLCACAPEGTGEVGGGGGGGGGSLILRSVGPESAEAKLTNQTREILAH